MENAPDMARKPGPPALLGVIASCAAVCLLLIAAWAAPAPEGADLGTTGRVGRLIGATLRQGWLVLPCPAAALSASTAILFLLGQRAPVGCGYAVALAGALTLALSLVVGGLTLAR